MLIFYHALASLLLLGLYPLLGNYTFLVMLSSILTDLDHLQLITQKRLYSTKRIKVFIKNYFKAYQKNEDAVQLFKGQIFLFHSIEFVALLAILSIFYKPLLFISFGCIFHILGDIIHHRMNGWPVLRWLSLSYGIMIYAEELRINHI